MVWVCVETSIARDAASRRTPDLAIAALQMQAGDRWESGAPDSACLLTLNCRRIANARILPGVYAVLEDRGYDGLLICTPAEFLGESRDAEKPDT